MARDLVLTAVCLFAVGGSGQGANGLDPQPGDALDVYEAVIRYRLQKFPADVKPAELKAYLAVDGKDPAPELLKRLRKAWPNLKPISEEPKGKGLRVYVKGLKFSARGAAELNAGYWFPTKVAGEGYSADHHVVQEKGRWVVQKVTNEISS